MIKSTFGLENSVILLQILKLACARTLLYKIDSANAQMISCMCVCTYVCMSSYTQIQTQTQTQTQTHRCARAHTHTNTHIWTHTFTYIGTYICIYIYIYIYIYMHTYLFTHTHTWKLRPWQLHRQSAWNLASKIMLRRNIISWLFFPLLSQYRANRFVLDACLIYQIRVQNINCVSLLALKNRI